MSKPIFSASWYRVADLKPRLRSHAKIHRHQYRGEISYVLQDLSMERFVRFSPAAYFVIGLMDGRRSVEEIWQESCRRLGDEAPTQDEVIQMLSQLYRVDVLQCDVTPDAAELLQRREEQARRQWQGRILSIFSWRFPLFDPERLLRWLAPALKPIFSWAGALLWLLGVIPGLILAAAHWSDLTTNMLDTLLTPHNLVLVWLLFPLIKAAHEFGHAFAVKAFGGEVHEMGVMLLVLTPVPYVDASSAWAFPEKWRRVIVGAAGMMVELLIASAALFIWLNVEPGTVRTLAYNTILIAGISTVLFNGNPLLRFDGYYILADLIEIPNLRTRANRYLGFLCERYVFGNRQAETPDATVAERAWFVSYGTLSFIYRIFVVVAILLYLSSQLFYLGAMLAVLGALIWAVIPLIKGLHFLFNHPRLRAVRIRAIAVTAIICGLVLAVLTLVPMPYRTVAEGIVWIPEDAFVRARTEGFVERIVAAPGARVQKGDVLIVLSDPVVVARERLLAARVQELEARLIQNLFTDRPKAELVEEELRYANERLTQARERAADLVVRSAADGIFVLPLAEDLSGRFVSQGQLLAYVVELGTVTVRAVVSQATIELVRYRTHRAEVRLAERLGETIPAVIRRIVPAASERLPARALGSTGGGEIPIDPGDRQGLTAVQKVFQVDLELPSHASVINLGGRGYVRFDHGWAPLALQWYRSIRQLFLSHFNV